MSHQINTTIVEIDPVVHRFATEYFNLPPDHTPVIRDAIAFVDEERTRNTRPYDFIVHDVFTGGVEPIELFTIEFLEGLRDLLDSEGTIAIVGPIFKEMYFEKLILRRTTLEI